MEYIIHRGIKIPLIGFGSWCVGNCKLNRENEINTMLYGINNYGMALIDTAEMYGHGESECVIADVLSQANRKDIFLIDKILPENAMAGRYEQQVRNSIEILGCGYIDLYLLHWRENVDLQDMVNQMERLVQLGIIRNWGVSNFDVQDMEDLFKCDSAENCFMNQILYNVSERGIEYDLIDWCAQHDVLPMAYSPLANNFTLRQQIKNDENIIALCDKHGITAESLMLAFVTRNRNIVTVFKTSSIEHLNDNMKDCFYILSDEDMEILNKSYPAPDKKYPLSKI